MGRGHLEAGPALLGAVRRGPDRERRCWTSAVATEGCPSIPPCGGAARYNVSQRVWYRQIDATKIDCPADEFDVVAFKSVLGAIGRNNDVQRVRQAVREMHRVLCPGGRVRLAENLQGSFLHTFRRRRFVQWGSAWRYVAYDELPGFFAGFEDLRLQCYGFWAALGRSEGQRTLLHAVDVVTRPLVPQRWRYVAFGCATK